MYDRGFTTGVYYPVFITGVLLLVVLLQPPHSTPPLGYVLLVYYILLLCYCGTTHHGIPYTASSLHSIPGGVLHTEHTYMIYIHTQHILHTYRVLPTQQ